MQTHAYPVLETALPRPLTPCMPLSTSLPPPPLQGQTVF